MNVTVTRLAGDALRARLDDLARLRIEVFRAWPYLYKGTMAYERQYLPRYAEAKTGTLIVAQNDGKIVGASTAAMVVATEASSSVVSARGRSIGEGAAGRPA